MASESAPFVSEFGRAVASKVSAYNDFEQALLDSFQGLTKPIMMLLPDVHQQFLSARLKAETTLKELRFWLYTTSVKYRKLFDADSFDYRLFFQMALCDLQIHHGLLVKLDEMGTHAKLLRRQLTEMERPGMERPELEAAIQSARSQVDTMITCLAKVVLGVLTVGLHVVELIHKFLESEDLDSRYKELQQVQVEGIEKLQTVLDNLARAIQIVFHLLVILQDLRASLIIKPMASESIKTSLEILHQKIDLYLNE